MKKKKHYRNSSKQVSGFKKKKDLREAIINVDGQRNASRPSLSVRRPVTPVQNHVLALYGGPVESSLPLGLLPIQDFRYVLRSIEFAQIAFNALLKIEKLDRRIALFLVHSISNVCTIHCHDSKNATVVVPLGLVARLRVLSKLLLRYWGKESRILLNSSPLDKIDENCWKVPDKLRPLFCSYDSDDQFWRDLMALEDILELSNDFAPDVLELLHLALVHAIGHEVAHFWQRHFDLQALHLTDKDLARWGFSLKDLNKAIELHADAAAGQLSQSIFLSQAKIAYGGNARDNCIRGFLRFGYAFSLLYSLYEPQRKYLYAYDNDRYSHPFVRRDVAIGKATAWVRERRWDLLPLWSQYENEGFQRFEWAMADLNLECMTGKFGVVEKDEMVYPIHLNYGGLFSVMRIARLISQSADLVDRFDSSLRYLADNGWIELPMQSRLIRS
jgi:hypothetical protein